jgi:hypothetical protein
LLSLGNDGWMQVADFLASGWLLLGFSVAVLQAVRVGAAPRPAPIVFSTMGLGLVAAGAFPTDVVDTPLSLHGELHYVATAVVAGSMAAACLLEWHDGRHDPGRRLSAGSWLPPGWPPSAFLRSASSCPQSLTRAWWSASPSLSERSACCSMLGGYGARPPHDRHEIDREWPSP